MILCRLEGRISRPRSFFRGGSVLSARGCRLTSSIPIHHGASHVGNVFSTRGFCLDSDLPRLRVGVLESRVDLVLLSFNSKVVSFKICSAVYLVVFPDSVGISV